MSRVDDSGRGRPRPLDAPPRNGLAEERLHAAFLVVLCSLCCLWVFQGSQGLDQSTETRQGRLSRLWELRQEARRAPRGAAPRHLRELDGLFPGHRVVLRREAPGPLLCLEPAGAARER